MAFNWDFMINVGVILAIILFVLSKITNQTLPEMIREIKDILTDSKDDMVERGQDLVYNE